MKKLICIYTCEQDKESLTRFKTTNLYKVISKSKKFQVIEVYAGATTTKIINNKLLLSCEEDYSNLSIKTYEMIKECVSRFKFDYLIKIDCNIFEYKNKNFGFPKNIKKDLFNEELVTNIMFSNKFNSDYFGSALTCLRSLDSLNKWATHKKLKLNCKKFNINFNEPYYVGKFYMCGRKFCEYISQNGKNKAMYFAENFGGVEDLYVGHLYAKYNREQLETTLEYLLNILEQKKYTESTLHYLYKIYIEFKARYKKYILENENCLNSDFFDFKKFKAKSDLTNKKINYIKTKLGIV